MTNYCKIPVIVLLFVNFCFNIRINKKISDNISKDNFIPREEVRTLNSAFSNLRVSPDFKIITSALLDWLSIFKSVILRNTFRNDFQTVMSMFGFKKCFKKNFLAFPIPHLISHVASTVTGYFALHITKLLHFTDLVHFYVGYLFNMIISTK